MTNFETHNRICLLTLDNKPHNLLEQPEFINQDLVIGEITKEKCKAIVITGAGRHFSSGADLEKLFEFTKQGQLEKEIEKGKDLLLALQSFNIPIIACIEGVCFGGGLEIALHADIRLASQKAMFAFPEANHDLIPGLGGIYHLTQLTGKSEALKNVLSGNIVNAETAQELKIIDELLPAKSTKEAGLKLAQELTEQRPLHVINAVTELIRLSEKSDYNDIKKRETELFCQLAQKALQNKQ